MGGGDSLKGPGSGRRSTGMRILGELMQTRIDELPEEVSCGEGPGGSRLAAHRPPLQRKPSKLEVRLCLCVYVCALVLVGSKGERVVGGRKGQGYCTGRDHPRVYWYVEVQGKFIVEFL